MIRARQGKRHVQYSNPVMSDEQITVCSCTECGKTFSEPIELTVQANGSHETYYACPHCFSKVSVSDNLKKRPSKAPPNALMKAVEGTDKDVEEDKPVGCAYSLGYLRTRPKGSSVPDACLTCASIMQCMGFV